MHMFSSSCWKNSSRELWHGVLVRTKFYINMWDISQRMRDFQLRQTQLPSALHSHAISTVNIQHITIVHFTTTTRLRQKRREKLWRGRVSEIFWGAEVTKVAILSSYALFDYILFQLLSRSKIVKNRILHFFYYYIEPSRSAFFQ